MSQESKTRPPLVERLRAARIRAGISQGEAAVAVGCTRESLNRFERNPARYSPELAYRLARLLGVRISADDLFAEVGS